MCHCLHHAVMNITSHTRLLYTEKTFGKRDHFFKKTHQSYTL